MSGSTKVRPVHEVRMGRIKAAIWENDTQNGARHNVTISRLYRDGDQWKDSGSFGRDDLPLVAKVVDQAHNYQSRLSVEPLSRAGFVWLRFSVRGSVASQLE